MKLYSERLELLGDSFLKYITTLYLFKKFPDLTVSQLSEKRKLLICNSFLETIASQHSNIFDLHNYNASNYIEILIGSCLQHFGFHSTCDFIVTLGILNENPIHTHYSSNHTTFHQYEFLGDSLLELLVTQFLHNKFENYSSQQLNDIRQKIINNNTLGYFSIILNLHTLNPFKNHPTLLQFIHFYNSNSIPLSFVKFPKLLGDIFEYHCAKILVHTHFDIEYVWKLINPLIIPFLDSINLHSCKNTIRQFYEISQQLGFSSHEIKIINKYNSSTIYLQNKILCSFQGDKFYNSKLLACLQGTRLLSQHF